MRAAFAVCAIYALALQALLSGAVAGRFALGAAYGTTLCMGERPTASAGNAAGSGDHAAPCQCPGLCPQHAFIGSDPHPHRLEAPAAYFVRLTAGAVTPAPRPAPPRRAGGARAPPARPSRAG